MTICKRLAFTLVLALVAVVTATAANTDLLPLQRDLFRPEVHPGPRPGCPLCDAMVQRIRGFSGQVVVPTDGIMLARSWVYEAGARNALVVADCSGQANVGLPTLAQVPKRVVVIHDIPTSYQLCQAIHGEFVKPTRQQISDLTSLNFDASALFRSYGAVVIDLKEHPANLNQRVLQELNAVNKDDLVVVMSHVDAGMLRFHDGSSVSLLDLQCTGQVAVIGCNTMKTFRSNPRPGMQVAVGRKLSYGEASETIRLILAQLKASGSYRDALLLIQNEPPGDNLVGHPPSFDG